MSFDNKFHALLFILVDKGKGKKTFLSVRNGGSFSDRTVNQNLQPEALASWENYVGSVLDILKYTFWDLDIFLLQYQTKFIKKAPANFLRRHQY